MCANGLHTECSDGPALMRSRTALSNRADAPRHERAHIRSPNSCRRLRLRLLSAALAAALSLSLSAVAHAERTDYDMLIQFGAQENFFAVYTDDFFSMTHFFFGDYPGSRIVRHTVDPGLNRTESALPIPYGVVWIAEDLDGDGHIELVVQRGDPGMGGNGYLDIHSAPDWVLRARITLPNMKLVFFPVAVEVDGDGDLEIFLAPGTMSGSARAMIIDYDRPSDTFVVRADIAAPAGTYGHTRNRPAPHAGRRALRAPGPLFVRQRLPISTPPPNR